MEISSLPSFRLTPPSLLAWQQLTLAEEEAQRQQEEMQEAAENEPFVSDPPAVDASAELQMGYLHSEESNLEIGGGFGLHYRPLFNLELNYNLSVAVRSPLNSSERETEMGLRQDLGITIINTLSEESKTNIGLRLAFTYIRDLSGGEMENLLGITTGFEFGNYTPRFFLEYTWLNDLNGRDLHQAAMGLRVPFKL